MSELPKINNPEDENVRSWQSIEELLPRYHEVYGDGDRLRYETLRLITVDGHDVAWMEYKGETTFESPEKGTITREYSGRELKCACDLTEGVGWGVYEDGRVYSMYRSKGDCMPREAAIHLRQLELRQEYLDRFDDGKMFYGDETDLWGHIPEIVLDLIEKGKAGEWLAESSSGAHDWGGYFYLQTVHEITQIPHEDLWKNVYKMMAKKQISLEGMVVQEYRKPPAPSWDEHGRYEYGGYTGIAELPSHSRMSQKWRITILAPNGRIIAEGIKGPRLNYDPLFGPDAQDVAKVEVAIREAIDQYLMDPMSQA